MKYLYPFLHNSRDVQNISEEKIERGEFGLKTGKGFFQYEWEEALASLRYTKDRDKKILSLLKTLS